jgi:hypothetical protein
MFNELWTKLLKVFGITTDALTSSSNVGATLVEFWKKNRKESASGSMYYNRPGARFLIIHLSWRGFACFIPGRVILRKGYNKDKSKNTLEIQMESHMGSYGKLTIAEIDYESGEPMHGEIICMLPQTLDKEVFLMSEVDDSTFDDDWNAFTS